MAAVARRSAGEGPAPLVSRSGQGRQARSSEVVERAKLELSARYGLLPHEAFELLRGLARAQRRSLEEYAESVVTSGGRLDGDRRGDSGRGLRSVDNGSGAAGRSPELRIEAPSAAAAFVLAGSLAEYGARAVVEEGAWRVVVDRCSSFSEGVPGALSRARRSLATCGLATATMTLNGTPYLLDCSTDGVTRETG
jgi:ANTAR domain-containing protein